MRQGSAGDGTLERTLTKSSKVYQFSTSFCRLICSPEQSHLVVSDEEFYGLQLADRLVALGAKKLFINLKKIPTSTIIKKQ